ncbi:MAG: methyltransferase domain-containing protein [Rhodospirillales bacterium]|nr:methyltransferase domain-containing protein [Rhodospirillales bacterium]
MQDPMRVFDRRSVRVHRDRAAALLPDHDFLLREVGERLLDRLDDVRRHFPCALDMGCHRGELGEMLAGRGGIETLVQCDLSEPMVRAASGLRVAADEEALPFADGSFDLVVSAMSLHWVNDLPGTLVQLRRVLRPDGLLLAALLGGETLKELRRALADAEITQEGGLSPRVSPFADVRDVGNLLQRAGFALPVVDADTITVSYGDPLSLLADLRGMGESNAVAQRRKTTLRRATLLDALARYRDAHADAAGRIPATFQVIFAVAWAPDATQPQPLRPGSALARLADALGSEEVPAGDPARP